jgi:hypothetical protein
MKRNVCTRARVCKGTDSLCQDFEETKAKRWVTLSIAGNGTLSSCQDFEGSGMHSGLLHGSRCIQSRWRLAGLLVLLAFGIFILDLPIHLVHHLDEVSPDCQLLVLSVSLNASMLDDGWSLTVDPTWDEVIVPVLLSYISPPLESSKARSPPATVQS